MPKLWSSAELAAHEFPNPAYLVEPVITQGGITLLSGKPGVGKTVLIMTLCHAISEGLDFLGWGPTRQGNSVVVQADMTGQIQQDRLLRVCNDINVGGVYWVAEEDGSVPPINVQTMTIMQNELVDAIQEVDPIHVVWDTLRRIHNLPENVSESAGIVYAAVRKIVPTAAHTLLHHTRKESRDPEDNQHLDEAFMGNQAWGGAADSIATLELLDPNSIPRRAVLTFHKARNASDLDRRPRLLELDMKTVTYSLCQ